MKKSLCTKPLNLLLLFVLLAGIQGKSQTLTVSNSTACAGTGTLPVSWALTSTLSSTAYNSFTMVASCSSGTFANYYAYSPTVTTGTMGVCPGNYTLYCNSVNSSSVVIGSASATGTFNVGSYPTINMSPNGGAGCAGTNFTISISGSGSYTTSGPFGTSTSTSIAYTPTASSCFTVLSSASSCTASSVRCFTLYSPPTVTITPTVTACSNNTITVYPSGATSYTWSTGSFLNYLSLTPTASACYTVTGSTPFCSGTSSAVTCINAVPAPTLSYGASAGNVCLGNSVTFTASGASNYTWSIGQSSASAVNSYTNNTSFTPTVAGNYFATLTGNSGGCNVYGYLSFTVTNVPNVSTSSLVTLCQGSGGNIFASGASSYTWSTGSLLSYAFVNPTVATCYTVTGSSPGCSTTSSAVACVSIAPAPTVSIAGPSTVCMGTYNTYTVTGASNYTWYTASSMTPVVIGATANWYANNGCMVIMAYNTSGCGVTNTFCPTTASLPTLSIAGTATMCAGGSVTLTASGAATYTWSTGSNATSIVVSPSSYNCYTVSGTNASGCTASAVKCVSVASNPVILAGGTGSICPGGSATLTASGASTYLWSNSASGSNIVVSPTASTCYTVTGTAVNGCTNTASKCVTILSTPVISIAGSNTVCIGSSVTFTANGGSTYTWNTSATTSTLYVLPTGSANYTVTASHTSNSCTSTSTLALTIYTNCAIVWPGDANRDGAVTSTDVFELGYAASSTGATRPSASISWTGQFANAWAGTVSSGWNLCHADCNGDGIIDNNDTSAISANFSLTHAFKSSSASQSFIDLNLVPQQSEALGGAWNVIDIVLGDATNNMSQLYGAAFDLDYDQTMVQADSVKLVYTPSFLNASTQNINFAKKKFSNGKLYAATVRTGGNNAAGNGKIAELWVKLNTGIADNSSFNFGINNGKRTSASAQLGILTTSGAMNLNVTNDAVGLKAVSSLKAMVRFYPNPARTDLTLENKSGIKTTYTVYDVTGRLLLNGEFTSSKTLDVSTLENGTYLIQFESTQGRFTQKLVIGK